MWFTLSQQTLGWASSESDADAPAESEAVPSADQLRGTLAEIRAAVEESTCIRLHALSVTCSANEQHRNQQLMLTLKLTRKEEQQKMRDVETLTYGAEM